MGDVCCLFIFKRNFKQNLPGEQKFSRNYRLVKKTHIWHFIAEKTKDIWVYMVRSQLYITLDKPTLIINTNKQTKPFSFKTSVHAGPCARRWDPVMGRRGLREAWGLVRERVPRWPCSGGLVWLGPLCICVFTIQMAWSLFLTVEAARAQFISTASHHAHSARTTPVTQQHDEAIFHHQSRLCCQSLNVRMVSHCMDEPFLLVSSSLTL